MAGAESQQAGSGSVLSAAGPAPLRAPLLTGGTGVTEPPRWLAWVRGLAGAYGSEVELLPVLFMRRGWGGTGVLRGKKSTWDNNDISI